MSYGNAGLNRVSKKDDSGFTPEQRHQIIMATLDEFGKGPQPFQLRWRENSGEYLTGDILLKTPMFWFMKYKWSRQEIETLFFKARVEIDIKFDRALQQTFGGDPGPRWKGGGGVKKKNFRRTNDYTQNNEIDEKEKNNDKEYHGLISQPDPYQFKYNPVVQPVDFQATGGVNDKNKDPNNKQYPGPDWERLKKKPGDDDKGSGPKMGKGKIPSDNPEQEKVKLQPVPDYSKWKEPTGDNVCTINVECPDGSIMKLQVNLNEPLHYVKKQIEYKGNNLGKTFPEDKQILYFNNAELLNNDATLESYGVSNGDTLQLSLGPITVNVVKKDGTKLQIMVDPHATIAKCKKEIEANTYPSIAANEQQLYFTEERHSKPNNELDDNYRTLYKYGIHDGDYLYLGGPTVWKPPKGDDAYPIYVECPDGRTLTLNVTAKDDIEYTKLQIQTITNGKYPVSAQRLWFKNPDTGKPKELTNNDATLGAENIKKGAVLKLGPIPISVETREGKILQFMVSPYEKVKDVKKMIEDKTKEPQYNPVYPVNEQVLLNKINDQELEPGKDGNNTIADYGIVANSELYLGGTIPVRIRKTDGTIFTVDVDPTKPCSQIKDIISKHPSADNRVPVKQQTLYFNNTELSDARPVKSYNIKKNDIIDLKQTYPIRVRQPNGKFITLTVSPDDTIKSIKQRLEDKTMPTIPIKAQTLKKEKDNEILDDDNKTVKDYNIVENDILDLSVDDDDPVALLEKILSRDAPQKERNDAMDKIHKNLGVNKKYNVLLDKDKVPLVNCGYAVQALDDDYKEPVAQNAIEKIPDIFDKTLDKEPELTMGTLDETLDSLFKIYDDPKARKLHPYAKKAINRIVDSINKRNDPNAINQLIEKLGEKVDTENINTPQVRKFAARQLQKTMFPEDNKLMNKIFADGRNMKKLPDVKDSDLEKPGSTARNWFDVATGDKPGPPTVGDKHRDLVAKSINEMITDPNPDNRQIGLNLADLYYGKDDKWKQRLDGHARPQFSKYKFGILPWEMKMPPKGPQKKYKVDPLEPVDYRIGQQTEMSISAPTMPDL